MFSHQLENDEGLCKIPGTWIIAHMEQEVSSLNRSALDYVLDGDKVLRQIQNELRQLEQACPSSSINNESTERLAYLHHEMEVIDGYTALVGNADTSLRITIE